MKKIRRKTGLSYLMTVKQNLQNNFFLKIIIYNKVI